MRHQTVLIIDDDMAVVKLLARELRSAGYDIVAAVDPVQGLMSAKRESPDLILLDLMMPAGGGMQLLDRLATVGRARVVVMTAMDEPGLKAQAQSHGATAFVKKPVEPKAVAALVQQLLPQQGSS